MAAATEGVIEAAASAKFLLWVTSPIALTRSHKLPVNDVATKYGSALSKCALKGSALRDALLEIDDARAELLSALRREEREAANPSLHVESARHVADTGARLASKIDVAKRSVQNSTPAKLKVDELEASWTSALEGNARSRPKRGVGTDYTSTLAAMAFDAHMARATAALARQAAAARLVEARVSLKTLHQTEDIGAAIADLKLAAGLWCAIDKDTTDLGSLKLSPAPPECRCAKALQALALASADRLAMAKAFAMDVANVKKTPASLLARLALGAAKNDSRAVDGLASIASAALVGAACACAAGSHAIANALAACEARKKDALGEAIGFSNRGLRCLNDFLSPPRGSTRKVGGGLTDDIEVVRKFAVSAPPELRSLLTELKATIQSALKAYEHDNRTIYFDAEPPELPALSPLEMAKPQLPAPDDMYYELSDPLTKKQEPPEAAEPPPPSYDSIAPFQPPAASPANRSHPNATTALGAFEVAAPAYSQWDVPPSPFSTPPLSAPPPAYDSVSPAPSKPFPARSSSFRDSSAFLSCKRCTFNNTLNTTTCAMCGHKLC